MILPVAAVPLLVASGFYAAWMDARYRRLPNVMVLIVAGLGLGANLWAGGWPQLGSSLAHAGIALAVGFGLFAAGVIGSGDSKYYAAVATWFPLGQALLLLGRVSVAGLLLALVWLLTRRLRRDPEGPEDKFRQVPFGIAIACGGISSAIGLVL